LLGSGDQLRRIKDKLEDVNDDVERANWILRGMSSVRGWFVNSLFSSPPQSTRSSEPRAATAIPKSSSLKPDTSKIPAKSGKSSAKLDAEVSAASDGPASRYLTESAAAYDREMDKSLEDISAQLQG
jgi:hypothetical protein